LPASRRQIDVAGERVRNYWANDEIPASAIETDPELLAAARLVLRYRASFQDPLGRVRMGLQSFVQAEGARVVVAQRLKRAPTIAGKLVRMPTTRLTQMQDIGGCRAILPSQRHVYDVLRRIRRNSEVRTVTDYVQEPKATGYRAVHAVVRRRGRLVEIQLRTPPQQLWAAEVDRAAGLVGVALKDGQGPPEIADPYRQLADEIAQAGGDRDRLARLEEDLRAMRLQVRQYAAENRG
jgi:ppGpp synthetase/RelA/SpoT-type nucleotidyltranferase